jgi:hypothetical protein
MKMIFIAGAGIFLLSNASFAGNGDKNKKPANTRKQSTIETFTYLSSGKTTTGKIYLPAAYQTNNSLPAIYLIDFTEQHFKLATDEYEKVIDGVEQIKGFDALVVTLDNIPDIDAEPSSFKEHYQVYKSMAAHVDSTYTNNPSRTFIGKGSEGGLVLMALFRENLETPVFDKFIVTDPSPKYSSAVADLLKTEKFPQNIPNKKLHFSFSTSNDRVKCKAIISLLHDAQYPWLQFESIEYMNSDYENTYPISYAAGIKYVFQ